MAILGFLSVLKKLSVRRYYQDPSARELQDYTEGLLSLYANKYTYMPKELYLADRDNTRPEWAAHIMKPGEVAYDGIIGLELRNEKADVAILVVSRREGGVEYYSAQSDQLQSTATLINSRLKTSLLKMDDYSTERNQQPSPQPHADNLLNRLPGGTGNLKIPIIGVGAQEKFCKYCDTRYPVKALYCPNCGAFETRKAKSKEI